MALNDGHQNFTYFNPAFVDTFGYSLADIPTLADWWQRAYPDPIYSRWVAVTWLARIEQASRTGEVFKPLELTVRCKDGSDKTFLASTAPISRADEQERLVVMVDITARKQAEEALHASESLWQAVFEHAGIGMRLEDLNDRTIRTNAALQKMLGYSEQELKNMSSLDFTEPGFYNLDTEQFAALLNNKIDRYNYEKRYIRKDQTIIWGNLTLTAVRDSQGNLQMVVAMMEDITRRKQAEADLLKSEARLRAIIDASPVPMALNDGRQQFTYFNAAFVDTLGYTLADIPSFAQLWPAAFPDPQYRSWVAAAWQSHVEQARQTGLAFTPIELKARCRDGSDKTLLATVAAISAFSKTVDDRLTVMVDITDRVQAEADLRDSEEKYRAVFNNEIYGIVIFDPRALHILDVNDAFCRMYGYTRDELLSGMLIHELFNDPPSPLETNFYSIEAGPVFIPLAYNCRKDGTVFSVEIVRSLYQWRGQTVMFSMAHDITARRLMEQELVSINARLEMRVTERTLELQQANRALADAQETERRALALELHDELGQVLNRVKLSLDMAPLLGQDEGRRQYQLASDLVREMIQRVRRMVIELRPSMLDEMGLLPTLDWLFDTYYQQNAVRVHFKSAGIDRRFSPGLEIGAYRIIQESLTNISRHAMNKSAAVEVRANEHTLHMRISDQGGGFDPQEALNRGNSTGLSGMRERARQLGGSLRIESTPGQGTVVTAALPINNPTAPFAALPAA